MTPLLVALLRRELEEQLLSSRISHSSQSSVETVELTLYHPNRPNRVLVFVPIPQKPLLFTTAEKRPALSKPPNFCRSLRKHLEFGQLVQVESTPGERILAFHFKTSEGIFRLIFEGIPKYPNLILVSPQGNILSALRYKNEVERPVMPQVTYAPPPQPRDKLDFWSENVQKLLTDWEKVGRPPLAAYLKDQCKGTDSELAAHLEPFGETAFAKWGELRAQILKKGLPSFTLLEGPPPSLRIFPELRPSHGGTILYTSASQALEGLYQRENQYRRKLTEKSRLENEINRALKHEKKILEKLKKDRQEAEKSDQYQWWGELLMAQLHKVKLHQSNVDLEDVVRGRPGTVSIPLDKEVTPLQNAQRFFKKAQKGSRGLSVVEKRELEIKDRLERLKAAQRSLPALQTPEETHKAFQDLFPKKPQAETAPKTAKPKEPKVPTPNIQKMKLGKEFEICAGTSAAANEYVTFQLAQPEDLWFHVRDLPGSHVILRRLQRDGKVTEEMVRQAAQMAADHSKAPKGAKITVSYTEKKNVKKIPGAPMGMVTMTKEKSLVVET